MLLLLLRFVHIAAAMVGIAGIIGREVIRRRMRRTEDVAHIELLAKLLTPFDRLMVAPGSTLLLVSGAALAVLRGWPLFGFLQGAQSNWLLVSWVLFLLTVPLVVLVFLPRGRVFEAALAGAVKAGHITEELKNALHDPVDRMAHRAEELIIAVVLFLMVVKPF